MELFLIFHILTLTHLELLKKKPKYVGSLFQVVLISLIQFHGIVGSLVSVVHCVLPVQGVLGVSSPPDH